MMIRRIASFAAAAFISIAALAISIADTASAQTHTTFHNGWRISIDESPSEEFVAQALADLQEYLRPPEPLLNLPWCCAVGNYGGLPDASQGEDEDSPFIRITDDLSEYLILIGPPDCDSVSCMGTWAFVGPYDSGHDVAQMITGFLDHSPNYHLPIVSVNSTPTPVFIGRIDSQHPLPEVWSAAIVAIPEPTSSILCLIAATIIGLDRRRDGCALRRASRLRATFRRLTSQVAPLLAFAAVMIVANAETKALGGQTAIGEWNVAVEEAPSPNFIAAARQDLSVFYTSTPDRFDDQNNGADDHSDNGFRVVPTLSGCENENCVAIDHFIFAGSSSEVVRDLIVEFLDGVDRPFYDQEPYSVSPIYWRPLPAEYAILIGSQQQISLSSPMWSVAISAIPEPSALAAMAGLLVTTHCSRMRRRFI